MGCGTSSAVSSVEPTGDQQDASNLAISTASFEDIEAILKDDNSEVLILDVRNADEYSDGHIPNSVNIPGGKLASAIAGGEAELQAEYKIPLPEKTRPIVTSCLSGRRAQAAADTLRTLGYTNVRVYRGSWSEWSSKGGPVEK